jgi:chromate transporter
MDMGRRELPPVDRAPIQDPPGSGVGMLELFGAFMAVGVSGFGGVLPFIRHMLVERRRWLTPTEFTEVLSLSQLLPGPNVVNITIYVGARFAGVTGALVAFSGLMLMPMIIVLGLGILYSRYGDLSPVADAFRGIASAAAGLVVAMAAKIAWPVLRSARTVVLALLVFVAMAVLKLPLVWTMAVLAPVSVIWTWWRTP